MSDEPEATQSDFAALVLVWLVFALPFTTPLLLASPNHWAAYMQSPYLVYAVGCGLIFATWIGTKDRWLGALLAWPVLMCLWVPKAMSYQTVTTMLLSGFALISIWGWRDDWVKLARWAFVGAAVFQSCYALIQPFGHDPMWGLWDSELVKERYAAVGTIGNNNWLGVYLGVLLPLMPLWAMPIVICGLLVSKCLTGIVAAICGLAWMHRKRFLRDGNGLYTAGFLALAIITIVGVLLWRGHDWPKGITERVEVWAFVAKTMPWWQWVIGGGPGSWSDIVPFWQLSMNATKHAIFLQGHNEFFQVIFETGVIGLLLMLGWVWAHRAMFNGPYGGALVAMGVSGLTMFGFRLAILGCTALVIIGLATRDNHERICDG